MEPPAPKQRQPPAHPELIRRNPQPLSSSREAIGNRMLSSMISPPVLLSTTAGTTMSPPSSSSLPSQPFTLDSTNSTIEEKVLARGMAMTNMRNKHENKSRYDVVKDG
mmetsp:Transcript_6128/g.12192  ORF Transcript_6128/g.12192 Transcript_6128/m.12192 type:complete len:108 (+) Transcript_6128:1885-2208(+)